MYQLINQTSNYTQLQFSPDTLLFQSCELDDAEAYGAYILGYDKKEKSVRVVLSVHVNHSRFDVAFTPKFMFMI